MNVKKLTTKTKKNKMNALEKWNKLVKEGKVKDDGSYKEGETVETESKRNSEKSWSYTPTGVDGSQWEKAKFQSSDYPQTRGRKAHELVDGTRQETGEEDPVTIALNLKLAAQARFHINGLFKNKIKEEQFRGKHSIAFLLTSGTIVTASYRERRTLKRHPTRVWIFKWGKNMTGIDVSPITLPVRWGGSKAPEITVDYYAVNDLIKKGVLQTGESWKIQDIKTLRKYNMNL